IFKDILKMLYQKIIYNHSDIRREQFVFFSSGPLLLYFLFYLTIFEFNHSVVTQITFAFFFCNITALLNGRYCWSIGRWSSDSQLLQFFHQTGFGVAWWVLGKSLNRRNSVHSQFLSFRQRRKHSFCLLFSFVVFAFEINL